MLDLPSDILGIVADAGDLLDDDVERLLTEQPLEALWDLITGRIQRDAVVGADADRMAAMLGLLTRIRAAESSWTQARLADRSQALTRIRAALDEVSSAGSVDELLTLSPSAACALGFDRALVSTVDTSWQLHTMCVVRDQRWADEIVAVGRDDPPVLDRTLVENDTVVSVAPTLVDHVQENPRVNRALAEVTKSSSYGIAPLLVDGEVVGLLHADCYHQKRSFTPEDQSMLSTFAAGVSQSLARVTLLDGVAALRSHLDGVTQWQAPARRAAASVTAGRHDDSILTRREAQIMRLMADGDGNAKIARRLVISEGTVKTHVTRILRKLEVTNRAEAVAVWLRADQRH
ncbi:LuxR C-terminal-related transcriptional regulator [Gordonia rhizosphera]|uniref:Putative LuxR family transcriptional regulator n=1 Tax=Gordonia rhizosphera NBRC 16068 TaxID=1108045 RepID=K6V8J7_9ACTN|nr:LuxR C-terminal-related transcriptional regulator [Gordonia rhizosphera]GAB92553.1 putative LuxR family transcriptional regulator [Gordonia rhizosphera NBRC 16068]